MNSIKNVLFISYDGMTDPLGQSQVIPYLQGLSKAGYNIYILSCEKKEAYFNNKELIKELLITSSITWLPISYTKSPPILSTLWDIVKLKRAAKKIHHQVSINLVHTRPGIPALVGLWMKEKYAVKFLNDIREFFADSRVEGNMWNIKNPLYKMVYDYFKRKESEAAKKNDGIVCLTNAAEKIIRQWPGVDKNVPLQVIPCSVDLNLFDPAGISLQRKELLRADLKLKETDIVISYLGSIGGWYLTNEMMQFCKMLQENIPEVKFLFISPHRHEEIITSANQFGLNSNNIITQKASRNQVPVLLSLSSYSVFFIKPCYSKQSSSPTKHGEIMAMGIPVITNAGVGDVKEIVERYNSGYVINDFSENSYKALVVKINNGVPFNKNNIRNGAKEVYALENAIESYKKIYRAILEGK